MVILNISQIKEKVKGKRKERTKWKGMNYTSVFLSNVPKIMACFDDLVDHARSCHRIKAEVPKVDHRRWREVQVLRHELLLSNSP